MVERVGGKGRIVRRGFAFAVLLIVVVEVVVTALLRTIHDCECEYEYEYGQVPLCIFWWSRKAPRFRTPLPGRSCTLILLPSCLLVVGTAVP